MATLPLRIASAPLGAWRMQVCDGPDDSKSERKLLTLLWHPWFQNYWYGACSTTVWARTMQEKRVKAEATRGVGSQKATCAPTAVPPGRLRAQRNRVKAEATGWSGKPKKPVGRAQKGAQVRRGVYK